MINPKLLIKLSGDLKALADSFAEISEAVKAETTAVEEKAKAESKVSMEDVRKVLAAKSLAGYTAEVRAIIQKYGAECLSGICEKDYPAVLKDAEELS